MTVNVFYIHGSMTGDEYIALSRVSCKATE
jgi:hypothetical protein